MRTTRIALVSLMVVLTGCTVYEDFRFRTPNPAPHEIETCTRAPCVIPVTVTAVGSTCKASIPKEFLKVKLPGSVPVHWEIAVPGGEFINAPTGNDGVKPKDPTKFENRGHQPRRFMYHFKGSTQWEKYDIHTRLNGVTCDRYDPYIMN